MVVWEHHSLADLSGTPGTEESPNGHENTLQDHPERNSQESGNICLEGWMMLEQAEGRSIVHTLKPLSSTLT
ncbi:hypothetical protein U0070_018421 [Myodes glareolus]|uniref:Uncharacterized protein n=1 Tax=Myodes glareolus TaxID=447135 RepID=A0AAW0JWF5_MYOGA